MNRIAKIVSMVFGAVFVMAVPAFAQGEGAGGGTVEFLNSNYIGVGLTAIGAAYGIGKLAASAYESMSRQPEVAGNIQTAMIIAAALIEGFTFFALFVCMG